MKLLKVYHFSVISVVGSSCSKFDKISLLSDGHHCRNVEIILSWVHLPFAVVRVSNCGGLLGEAIREA